MLETKFDAVGAKLMGWWVPHEGEKVPAPMTKPEWHKYMERYTSKPK